MQMTLSNKRDKNSHIDKHFEEMSAKSTLIEINKTRTLRKIKNLETCLSQEHINLDKLKELAWTGIP
jgi:hypothetical protein